MPFAIGGNQLDTGYNVNNSLRFNYLDSPKLSFTPSSSGNDKIATASFWLKRGTIRPSHDLHIMGSQQDGSNFFAIRITSSGKLEFLNSVSGSTSNGFIYKTNMLLRDHSAWYHIVVAMDVTQSDGNNGLKAYVNGVLQDAYSISSYNQNVGVSFNTAGEAMKIGIKSDDSEPLDGYLAEFHWIDGTQKQASDFGEYNDNGVWIPKEYEGTYGTNGFFLEFKQTGTSANSSGIGADTSGNDNHFTPSNLTATDITTDTCTNNFATFNPLIAHLTAGGNPTLPTYSEGNTKTVTPNSGKLAGSSTIMKSRGKWYAEFKFVATNNAGSTITSAIGITDSPQRLAAQFGKPGERSDSVAYINTGSKLIGDSQTSFGNSYTTGDIIGVALDLDNNAIYFSKNGTFQNSGDPTSGSSKTNAISVTDPASTVEGGYFFAVGEATSETSTFEANFGNAPYTISSGNSDAEGHGNFEYAVPSGYFALCTKNLAEYG